MHTHAVVRGPVRRPSLGLAALALATIAGCQTTRPDPAAEQTITHALALHEAITFRVEAGPLDEPRMGDGTRLGIADAVRFAVTTDPALQGALARVRIAMAEADQARLFPNPILGVVLRWGPGKPQIEATLAQDFIQILQAPRRAGAADNRLRQSAADAVTVALDVVADVQERYAAAQATDALMPILEERRELLGKVVGVAQSRLRNGEGTRSDLTTLDAQRAALEVEIAGVKLRQREERLRLARLIGEPSGAAVWMLDPWSAPAPVEASETAWITGALEHRPEVQSVAWRLAALGDDYALTSLLPWEGASAGVDVQHSPDWFAGPSISSPIPVFDMGQARRAKVSAEQVEARHALTQARRKVVEEVRLAYESLAANRAILERTRGELIPAQEQRRAQAESAYRLGQTDVTALFLAEQDLRSARATALDIERQTTVAMVRLERAVGGAGFARAVSSAATDSPTNPTIEPTKR